MNRIDYRFRELAAQRRKGLIPFVTCGDPSLEATVPVLHALVAAGADLLELGVPFSDPQADGPVIQRASERALERHVGLPQVLECVREFRRSDGTTPMVLMGYLNPIEVMGTERFVAAAHEAGVDGVLLVDCPPEESTELRAASVQAGMQQVLLAAPTTDSERVQWLLRQAQGYLYYVAFAGVTGAAQLQPEEVGRRVAAIRRDSTVPIAVGFGVKDADSAQRVAQDADAVVIGSALVERLAEATAVSAAVGAARAFLAPIRAALDSI